jgi:hypothetical protein
MEIFLITFVLILQLVLICLSLFHFLRIHVQLNAQHDLQLRIIEVLSNLQTDEKEFYRLHLNKIDEVSANLDRSLLALRESLETAKPIKPNNWDSFREAFKGPTRVEINERN